MTELMNTKEVAVYTRLAEQTIYDYRHKNRIPYFKAGKRLLFRTSEIDKWLLYGGNEEACERVRREREGVE